MPIYEYRCSTCAHVMSILVQGFKDPEDLHCEQCDGADVTKIISPVNYHASHTDRLASFDPRSQHSDGFYRDTRNIGLEAERMLKKCGVEPPDDFKAKLDKVRSDPSSVIKD